MALSENFRNRALPRLELLYPGSAKEVLTELESMASRYTLPIGPGREQLWDERDAVLITYGDQVRGEGGSALAAQQQWLLDHGYKDALGGVHILPFCPYSSDDGFSVIDYNAIDDIIGDWSDVERLGDDFDLMFDLVLNHCSSQSEWFQKYLAGEEPYTEYFIEADPTDPRLSQVVRPRSLPLLSPFDTANGPRHLWTTFSDDQIDLNFGSVRVLIEMLDVLLNYAAHGARIIRLDAIAYLWKELGTTCIHLQQTHEVVKLMRDLLDECAPGTILLTETNVPHRENVSYFGDGDEAQMVYQFSLAPLLLDAFLTGDGKPLTDWLTNLEETGAGTTYFNFTASHDGIGVRPAEGLLPTSRIGELVESVKARGGRVSTKRNADGSDSPYELNITWFSALGEPDGSLSSELHARRFLSSQAVMIALRGIPGIYFQSLFGAPNDLEGMAGTGRARTINRRKYQRDDLDAIVSAAGSPQQLIAEEYRRMLAVRRRQPAFHPDAAQTILQFENPALVGFVRESSDGQIILVVVNLSADEVQVDITPNTTQPLTTDLMQSDAAIEPTSVTLPPYGFRWLVNQSG
ncbi:alpha-amylase family glycosyl hydrolase [Thalassoroseus pseudoceratinae]|uniref:alpha-amylase family glycosyl hydrolase n=1 Tax=Thalassoroseus pseudoceratinae TaxID=2713176 RepID=UPI00141E3A1F|nr:alpha-amylase family glycosyl hydrolase [Thalassoroseus pseudoceratinae]